MRILLDECVDRRFAGFIAAHEVRTVGAERWAGLSYRRLLERASGRFDVFVTTDQNLPFQQNLSRYPISFVILVPERPGFDGLVNLAAKLNAILDSDRLPLLTWVPQPPG